MRTKAQAVSIVIPVFNEENYITMCLDALSGQLDTGDEIVIVDNNCTDKTIAIARTYPFVRVIQESKPGVLFARNAGFKVARGDIIARIDADTVVGKNWVAYLRQLFEDTTLMAVTGPAGWYDMPISRHNAKVDVLFKYPLYKYDTDFPFLFGTNMAVRKSAWKKVANELCTNRTMHEDVDVAIHFYKHDLRILYDPQLVVSCSSRRFDASFKDFRRYIRYYQDTYARHGINTIGIAVAMTVYTCGYIVLWPLRQSYDEKTRKRSFAHLFGPRNVARKDPMAKS